MSTLFADLQWRGLIHQVTDPALAQLLDGGGMTVYYGVDPTADSLHVGQLLQLVMLRRMQQAGHKPILLAGGATGMIGDPSFKATERPLLDDETLARNVAGIEGQLGRFLEVGPGPTSAVLVNNYEWTKPVSALDFLRDVGKHFTVNQLLARDSVRARLEDREQGISFTEFSYSLLQAFDYWHLYVNHRCTLQIGGSDQWGNILSGVDLVRRREQTAVFGLSTPLVTKADGMKFGKTESGTVWLDQKRTSPFAFHQFFVRTEDAVVVQYLKFFTLLSHERIDELAAAVTERPKQREAQSVLAAEVTALVHGPGEAARAEAAAAALFRGDVRALDAPTLIEVFAEAPSITVGRDRLGSFLLVDALAETGLSPSKTAARTAISQGGVTVTGEKTTDAEAVLGVANTVHDHFVVLRRGKRDYAVVRFD